MVPKYHIILGFILSVILFSIFPEIGVLEFGVIFLSSFMIDIDHYFYFVFKKRNLNPKKAVRWFFGRKKLLDEMDFEKRKKYYLGFYFLHGIEFLTILLVFGIFLFPIFLFVFLGCTFHLFLDYSEEIYFKIRLDKISIIWDFFKFKKLKEIK